MLTEIAPVDTGYIRQSAQEIGGILKEAVTAQISEVEDILAIQAETVQAAETINMLESCAAGSVNLLA